MSNRSTQLDRDHLVSLLERERTTYRETHQKSLALYKDAKNDFTNGFSFGITPAGVQREGLITDSREVSADWDNKWFSAVHNTDEYWSFEMAIPFKSIRYNPDSKHWNMMFLRLDLKNFRSKKKLI